MRIRQIVGIVLIVVGAVCLFGTFLRGPKIYHTEVFPLAIVLTLLFLLFGFDILQRSLKPKSKKERTFSLREIEEAIEAAKGMVLDANIDERTKIIQMGGYILRHLNETPEKKVESTTLVHKKGEGFSLEK